MMKPYGLHIAYVSWQGFGSGNKGKQRPVLILSHSENQVAVFQITSKYDSKSATIRSNYIAIDDWANAGLTKKSYIDIGRIIDLQIETVQATPIGKLSANDLQKLLSAITK